MANKNHILLATLVGVVPMAAQAAPELYGTLNVHLAKQDSVDETRLGSVASNVGVRGSEDLESGLKLIYKVEFEIDPTERGANDDTDGTSDDSVDDEAVIKDRDQWLGISSPEFGTLRVGTISTSYKSSGALLDPMWNTFIEARGMLLQMSGLHGDAGPLGGRSTNTIRYDTPAVGDAKIVATYALGEGTGQTLGFGIHYESGPVKAFVDFIDADDSGKVGSPVDGSAFKLGGQYDFGNGLLLGGQYEDADADMFPGAPKAESAFLVNAIYMAGNTAFTVSYGGHEDFNRSYALAVDHKLGSATDVYFAYGVTNYDDAAAPDDDDIVGAGLRHKFQ